MERGYIWLDGDGTQIDIWSDSWIPNSLYEKIITPRHSIILSKV
jgi:hypothetical protein